MSATLILPRNGKLTCKALTLNVALTARQAVAADPHITLSILSFEGIKIKCANLDVRNVVHMKTSNSSEATGEMLFSV